MGSGAKAQRHPRGRLGHEDPIGAREGPTRRETRSVNWTPHPAMDMSKEQSSCSAISVTERKGGSDIRQKVGKDQALPLGKEKRDCKSLVAREASNSSLHGDDYMFVVSLDHSRRELCHE